MSDPKAYTKGSGRWATRYHEDGNKYKDACHVASAILAGCQYFVTTDKRLLKYRSAQIKLVNPITFVSETEEESK